MNLLHDPWMPVRDGQGRRHWIRPDQLSDPDWRAFDADRPDFNGALAQFAIGLLQTTSPVNNPIDWRRFLNVPPDATTLRQWFEPVAAAFVLDGDGPRFMQDLALATEVGKVSPIAEILIDAPGESSVDGNKDLFVKRGVVLELCTDCAAAAVLTLQINAPEGGRGHYTGLRGGGPLTTLLCHSNGSMLWQDLWLNVIEGGTDPNGRVRAWSSVDQATFPWMGAVDQLQPPGGSITSAQVNQTHAFWATPRRVRLDFEADPEPRNCSICGRPRKVLSSRFRSRPNGIDYPSNAWLHPLSPYREKEGTWLPLRPKGDGLGYRHWLAWVAAVGASVQRRASVVDHALTHRQRQLGGQLRLWAFGYEMRKDNPICWHEGTLPLFEFADCDTGRQALVQSEVARWIEASELACAYLRNAVKDAWFSADARGDLSAVDASFWSATEPAFYRQLQALIEAERDGIDHPPLPVREAWHAVLARTALRLFDTSFVGSGAIERQNPRRAALAHQQLRKNLYGPKLKLALGLPVEAAAAKAPRKTTRRPNNTNKEAA